MYLYGLSLSLHFPPIPSSLSHLPLFYPRHLFSCHALIVSHSLCILSLDPLPYLCPPPPCPGGCRWLSLQQLVAMKTFGDSWVVTLWHCNDPRTDITDHLTASPWVAATRTGGAISPVRFQHKEQFSIYPAVSKCPSPCNPTLGQGVKHPGSNAKWPFRH